MAPFRYTICYASLTETPVAEIAPDSTASDIAASKTRTVEPESAPATNPVFSHEAGPGSEPTRDGAKPAMSDSFQIEATSEDTQHSRAFADAGVFATAEPITQSDLVGTKEEDTLPGSVVSKNVSPGTKKMTIDLTEDQQDLQ
jgi:hypothetical protein